MREHARLHVSCRECTGRATQTPPLSERSLRMPDESDSDLLVELLDERIVRLGLDEEFTVRPPQRTNREVEISTRPRRRHADTHTRADGVCACVSDLASMAMLVAFHPARMLNCRFAARTPDSALRLPSTHTEATTARSTRRREKERDMTRTPRHTRREGGTPAESGNSEQIHQIREPSSPSSIEHEFRHIAGDPAAT